MAEELTVKTPLVAKKSTDEEHPGIYLTVYSKDGSEEACLLAEYCDKEYNNACRDTKEDSIVLRISLEPSSEMEVLQEVTAESIQNNTVLYNSEILKGV